MIWQQGAHQFLKETRKTAKTTICRCELNVSEVAKTGQTINNSVIK